MQQPYLFMVYTQKQKQNKLTTCHWVTLIGILKTWSRNSEKEKEMNYKHGATIVLHDKTATYVFPSSS